MNSTTGASFSAGSVTLEFTGTAATGLTFNVYNATGGVIGTVTGTASPLSITLDPGAIPSGPSVTLSADAHADTLFVNWAGTVTFHLS